MVQDFIQGCVAVILACLEPMEASWTGIIARNHQTAWRPKACKGYRKMQIGIH